MINNVKEQRDIETNQLTGYLVNETMFVPIDSNNTHYQEIQKWLKEGNTPEPSFTEEERLEYFKNKALNRIQQLADSKTKELKNYVAGKKLTDEQIYRYEQKYQLALQAKENNDYTAFELEAELSGIIPEELVDLIIQKHNEWMNDVNTNVGKIEAYRIKAQTIINGLETIDDIIKAMNYFEKAKDFDVNTTDDEIKEFFENFSLEEE